MCNDAVIDKNGYKAARVDTVPRNKHGLSVNIKDLRFIEAEVNGINLLLQHT